MHSPEYKSCVLCGFELEQLESTDALAYICTECAPQASELAAAVKATVVSAVRRRIQRGAPTLFAMMQALWRRSQQP